MPKKFQVSVRRSTHQRLLRLSADTGLPMSVIVAALVGGAGYSLAAIRLALSGREFGPEGPEQRDIPPRSGPSDSEG